MFTPDIAALVVWYFIWRPRKVIRTTGMTPLRPLRRVGGYSLLALLIFPVIDALATFLAALFGIIRLDLTAYSGFRAAFAEQAPSLVPYLPDCGFPLLALLAAVGFVAVSIFYAAALLAWLSLWLSFCPWLSQGVPTRPASRWLSGLGSESVRSIRSWVSPIVAVRLQRSRPRNQSVAPGAPWPGTTSRSRSRNLAGLCLLGFSELRDRLLAG